MTGRTPCQIDGHASLAAERHTVDCADHGSRAVLGYWGRPAGRVGHAVRVRAAVRVRYGGPEVISFDNVPEPVPGRGEILVRVQATTVNRTDCAYRSGHPWINRVFCGWPRPRVQVLGSEYAGVVVGIGEGVGSYALGERVFGFVDGRPGAHAELVAVPVDGLVARVPATWDLADAAPGMEGAHYAHACLRVTNVGLGDRVLVHGATGAIGTALVQLLHAGGVEVTAVCDRLPSGRPALLTELGAARVVELDDTAEFGSVGGGFDAVIDATGHISFATARRLLRPGGSYVSSDLGRGGGKTSCSPQLVQRAGRWAAATCGSRCLAPTLPWPRTCAN